MTFVDSLEEKSQFPTTQWNVIALAQHRGNAQSRAALATLCQLYRQPTYAYLRRRGFSTMDAGDLTQGFFLSLIERDAFSSLDRSLGRFRAWLLASLKHYCANIRRRDTAIKRGGGLCIESLDEMEAGYQQDSIHSFSPEDLYCRHWAYVVFREALALVEHSYAAQGKAREFELLRAHLDGYGEEAPYKTIALALGKTPDAVKQAVFRLRAQFREAARALIGKTVTSEAQIDEELAELIHACGRTSGAAGV